MSGAGRSLWLCPSPGDELHAPQLPARELQNVANVGPHFRRATWDAPTLLRRRCRASSPPRSLVLRRALAAHRCGSQGQPGRSAEWRCPFQAVLTVAGRLPVPRADHRSLAGTPWVAAWGTDPWLCLHPSRPVLRTRDLRARGVTHSGQVVAAGHCCSSVTGCRASAPHPLQSTGSLPPWGATCSSGFL